MNTTAPAACSPFENQLDSAIEMFAANELSLDFDLSDNEDEVSDAEDQHPTTAEDSQHSPQDAELEIHDEHDHLTNDESYNAASTNEAIPANEELLESIDVAPNDAIVGDEAENKTGDEVRDQVEEHKVENDPITAPAINSEETAGDVDIVDVDEITIKEDNTSSSPEGPDGHENIEDVDSASLPHANQASLAENLTGFTILEDISAGQQAHELNNAEQAQSQAVNQEEISGLYQLGGTQSGFKISPTPDQPQPEFEPSGLNQLAVEPVSAPDQNLGEIAPIEADTNINIAPSSQPLVDISDQISMMNDMENLEIADAAALSANTNPEFALTDINTSTSQHPTGIKKSEEAIEVNVEPQDLPSIEDPNEAAYDILSSLDEPSSAHLNPTESSNQQPTQGRSPDSSSTYMGNLSSPSPPSGLNPPLSSPPQDALDLSTTTHQSPQQNLIAKLAPLLKRLTSGDSTDLIKPLLGTVCVAAFALALWAQRDQLPQWLPANFVAMTTQNDTASSASDDLTSESSSSPSSTDSTSTPLADETSTPESTPASSNPEADLPQAVSWGAIADNEDNPYANLAITPEQETSALPSQRPPLNPWAYPAYHHRPYPHNHQPDATELNEVDLGAEVNQPNLFDDIDPAPFDPSVPDVIAMPPTTIAHSQPTSTITQPATPSEGTLTSTTSTWSNYDYERRLAATIPYPKYEMIFHIHHHHRLDKIPTLKALTLNTNKPWLILYSLSILYDFKVNLTLDEIKLATADIPPRILRNWVKKFRQHHPQSPGALVLMRALIRSANARTRQTILSTFYHHRADQPDLTAQYILAGKNDPNPYVRTAATKMSAAL